MKRKGGWAKEREALRTGSRESETSMWRMQAVVDAGMLTSILDTSAWRNLLSQLRSSSRPRDRALILIRLIVVARGGGEVWERAKAYILVLFARLHFTHLLVWGLCRAGLQELCRALRSVRV